MKKTLQMLSGAIRTNSPINLFKCFHLYGDRIQAQDGRITIDAPCPLPGDYTADADRYTKAVNACDGAPTIKLTDGGKLSLKKGGFRAIIPLSDHTAYPRVGHMEGGQTSVLPDDSKLLPLFAKLLPMCAEDDPRIWTCGISLASGYAWATDGIIMTRSPLPFMMDAVINIPADAIAVLVKLGIEPRALYIEENAITFNLGDVWMRAQLLNVPWPDAGKHFNGLSFGDALPDGLREEVEKLIPFCTDQRVQEINFSAKGISTVEGEHFAQIDGITLPDGRYSGVVLGKALTVATHANFAAYPAAVGFRGDGIEGVFMGLQG